MDNAELPKMSIDWEMPLQFNIKALRPDRVKTSCLVVWVYENHDLTRSAEIVDRASGGRIRAILQMGDFSGKVGQSRLLYGISGILAERVLVVGLGKNKSIKARLWIENLQSAVKALVDTGAKDAHLCAAEIPVEHRNLEWKAQQFVAIATGTLYQFRKLGSVQTRVPELKKLTLGLLTSGVSTAANRGIRQGSAIAAGMSLAKDLGNLPGNICTPAYIAEQAIKLGKHHKFPVQVMEQGEMEKLGMGALLSVCKGTRQPAKFIVLRYWGAGHHQNPVVLVGKGITFDSGGISLKPGAGMDEMKYDMCGAASVLGTLSALAEMRLKMNVIGLIPATENMPGSAASKPGDIVTSMSGKTIEILNTDAEGRLILCDALTYAERFNPALVIDIATLTGACIVALGHICSGVFSNNDALARELVAAGEFASDRAWQLPLSDEYQEDLQSNFADMANVGGRAAGSITAAAFLSRYASKFDWAHIDIAGTAWVSGKQKGATGRPVPLLVNFLLDRARKH